MPRRNPLAGAATVALAAAAAAMSAQPSQALASFRLADAGVNGSELNVGCTSAAQSTSDRAVVAVQTGGDDLVP